MPDFSKRSNEEEIMDDLSCSGDEIVQTLKELEIINKWLGGNNVTIKGLEQLNLKPGGKIIIADLGCGGGDILKLIARWGRKKKLSLSLIGVDANPNIIEYAKNNCLEYSEIEFMCEDIFSDQFQNKEFDIITSTLFTHHFDNDQLKSLYPKWLKSSRIGVVINDLHRHWFAYYSIKWLTGLFSKSNMVKNDAAVSVMRSFKRDELFELFESAKINDVDVKWRWAFRWQIVIANNGD